jgi:23S rRNA pseudouridine1911/1915/1917 synthase
MNSVPAETRELIVSREESGSRLDVFLARHIPAWSRSQVQRLIRSGWVTVNSRAATKTGQKVAAGDRVTARLEREELRAAAEELPLDIVYEDADLVVINKPAGMVIHVGAGVKRGTLVNALLQHVGNLSRAGGELRPGIVHRLDKMTSGLVVVAKNDLAHRALAQQFKSRTVRKTYLALVHGRVAREAGEITAPVGRDPVRRVRMKVGGIKPREAVTRYRVLRRFSHFTLLEAEPRTGRTHQIRVHLAFLGHPIVGDRLYGAPARVRLGTDERPTLERNYLHAAEIELRHPRTSAPVRFAAPQPPELQDFLCSVASAS